MPAIRNYYFSEIFSLIRISIVLIVCGTHFAIVRSTLNVDVVPIVSPQSERNKVPEIKIIKQSNEDLVSFTSATNQTFRISTDIDHNDNLKALAAKKVEYLRSFTDIVARGKLGNCTPALDVLAWLTNEVNLNNITLLIAYGELIHVHREKDFIHKATGKYIDDDIDLWAPLETLVHVGRLEPDIFRQFGWTARAFIDQGNYVTFLQIMSVCGHRPIAIPAKIVSNEPGIEIYGVALVPKNSGVSKESNLLVKDLWMGNYFPKSMFYPPQHISLRSAGTSQTLHLQLPNKALDVMTCLYGDWTIPAGTRGKKNVHFENTSCVTNKD